MEASIGRDDGVGGRRHGSRDQRLGTGTVLGDDEEVGSERRAGELGAAGLAAGHRGGSK